jgi:hypothetical protein
LGKHDVFTHGAGQLPGTSQKEQIAAGIFPSGPALIALAAIHRRVNGNPLTGFYAGHFFADLLDDARSLVPNGEGKLNNLGTDPASGEIMNVRAADAHHFYPDEHVGGFDDFGFRHLSDFELSDAGE